MKSLEEQFNKLGEELKLTDKSKDQLKRKIMQNVHKSKKHNIKQYVWIAVAVCMLLMLTSPIYSPTMAKIAERILPISITPSFSDGQYNPDLTSQLAELANKEGYTVNFVGITPSPYIIEISLILKDSTLKQAINDLEAKITNYLYENGYDQYELKFSEEIEVPYHTNNQEDDTYEKVCEIVKQVFTANGYAQEADYELAGVKRTWFSNIVLIDMPDHIQQSEQIIADIDKEIKSQKLNVKDIEVTTFNFEHRRQDNRWAYISSDIYDAMAGKSTYQLTGLSYKVRKGHSYVSIKTDFNQPPSEEIIKEIEKAVQDYLALPETKEVIQDDKYTVQFLLKNEEESFIKITN
ncbi:DUF4030 domain-containing protein [Lysinibacillus pakistanensis]|uniref:DUF4030 domain-containing protein n=1 Tax=Lysinibacillus pakistanensis TaxID=759811 RepID=A0ABX6DBQ3_9BACI|nr:DUF4030 domain-containing protein [Lysinibacillus pakistanensis]